MRNVAVVTGASSGVGREFVRQLDRGAGGPLDAIWLVARRADVLAQVARETSTATRVLPLDLAEEASCAALADALAQEDRASREAGEGGLNVQWLVNAAGFGKFGQLRDMDEASLAGMVRLNCLGLLEVTYQALPYAHPGSRVVNLSSIAGVLPQPRLSAYSATKSFVLELSRTLDHELKGTGVRVMALCPKFMRTGFLDEPGDAAAARGMCRIGFTPVDQVVSRAIRAAVLGRSICIPSADMRVAAAVARVLPAGLVMDLEDVLLRDGE